MLKRCTQPLTEQAERYLANLEQRWEGSIHLTMLGTPLRRCVVTQKTLPNALLIRLNAVTLPPPTPTAGSSTESDLNSSSTNKSKGKAKLLGGDSSREVILPDQILHPKVTPRKRAGRGIWMTLDSRILQELYAKGSYKMLNPKAAMLPGLGELIQRQLGQRVIQEIQLLNARIKPEKLEHLVKTYQDETALRDHLQELEQKAIAVGSDSSAMSFAISSNAPPSGTETLVSNPKTPSIFHPKFVDDAQTDSLAQDLHTLAQKCQQSPTSSVYAFYQHPATAPLGVSLYRLNLWTRSLQPQPLTA